MISYDFNCKNCHLDFIEYLSYDKRDLPIECPDCGPGSVATRVFRTVNNLKASFPDGHKRAGFQELKADAALRAASVRAEEQGNLDDYKEINKERTERDNKKQT